MMAHLLEEYPSGRDIALVAKELPAVVSALVATAMGQAIVLLAVVLVPGPPLLLVRPVLPPLQLLLAAVPVP